jgi:hypothetical protein
MNIHWLINIHGLAPITKDAFRKHVYSTLVTHIPWHHKPLHHFSFLSLLLICCLNKLIPRSRFLEKLIVSSASHEVPWLIWNPKAQYHVHNSLPWIPILSLMNPIHTLPTSFLMKHSNIILPSTHGIFKCSLSLKLPNQNSVCISQVHACYIPIPYSLILSLLKFKNKWTQLSK